MSPFEFKGCITKDLEASFERWEQRSFAEFSRLHRRFGKKLYVLCLESAAVFMSGVQEHVTLPSTAMVASSLAAAAYAFAAGHMTHPKEFLCAVIEAADKAYKLHLEVSGSKRELD